MSAGVDSFYDKGKKPTHSPNLGTHSRNVQLHRRDYRRLAGGRADSKHLGIRRRIAPLGPQPWHGANGVGNRSEEHTAELQSLAYIVCRLLLEKKKKIASARY